MNRVRFALLPALPLLLLPVASCAPASSGVGTATFRPGLEVFLEQPPAWIAGKRIGLITNHAGVDRAGNSNVELLAARPDVQLVALFAFEHGIRGDAPAGSRIASTVDERSGLPVHSLYGETYRPTPEMLADVDVLIYDVQDSGARPYTRVSTMALSMQAAAEKGIPFVVLDRPNPIGGTQVEGGVLDTAFASFVGMYPIPMRHGMTLGELARFYNDAFGIGSELTVVPMEGWSRTTWYDQTGLEWRAPSPNIRRLEAAIMYPGTVLIEGTNLSEGRGTDAPFEQVGAPWLRADDVADGMNALELPGIRFEAVRLAIEPGTGKYPDQTIPGVRFVLTDRDVYEPVSSAVQLIDLVRRLHPDDFEWRGAGQRQTGVLAIDRLAGTDRLRLAIDNGTTAELLEEWRREVAQFHRTRAPYLLY